MPSPASTIGQAELEILRYIQERHPVTVRQVADHVSETKGHVRTTVLNVMTRLVRKRYLVRRKQGASTSTGRACRPGRCCGGWSATSWTRRWGGRRRRSWHT